MSPELEVFTHAFVSGADSLTLAEAKADLDAAYRVYVMSLHLQEKL